MSGYLNQDISRFARPAQAKKLQRLGIQTGWDLLYHLPRRWFRRGELTPLAQIQIGSHTTIAGTIAGVKGYRNPHGPSRVVASIDDGTLAVEATFFARKPHLFEYYQRRLSPGAWVVMSGRASLYRGRIQLVHPEFLDIEAGDEDLAAKVLAPIPIYPATAGLPSWRIGALVENLLNNLDPSDLPEVLPAALTDQLGLMPRFEALKALHTPTADTDTRAALATLRAEEAFTLQVVIAKARERAAKNGAIQIPQAAKLADKYVQNLPFSLRPAQVEVLAEITGRLQASERAQQLLLQADVGAGKTVIAALCAAAVRDAGYQVALLAPTEVLARQHAESISALLQTEVALLTGSTALKERRELTRRILNGEPLIVVGTHALLNIRIPSLALAIVDEQHRFGVAQRDHLRNLNEKSAHLLVMTATPIPRSLAMTVFGDLEAITMRGVGARSGKVQTTIVPTENHSWVRRAWERAGEEIAKGGRVFVVVPRVEDDPKADLASVDQIALEAAKWVGAERVAKVWGSLESGEIATAIAAFKSGQRPLLVATTVIEVGLDIPNASMMMIMDADRFGLAALHQLRGRVGRGGQDGLCLALSDAAPDSFAYQRLSAFAEITDGFALAEKDLELRSAGDVSTANQSGRSELLVDPLRDVKLISACRAQAQALIESDPQLQKHPHLAAEIERRLSTEQVQRLEQS